MEEIKKDKQIPQWFKKVSMVNSWQKWHKRGIDAKKMVGIPLFINVQTKEEIANVHQIKARAITYISFMDVFVDFGVAKEEWGGKGMRIPYSNAYPEILLINREGRFVNTLMDNSYRMNRYLVCPNNPTYVKKAIECVRRIMDMGSDGLFIDNVDGCGKECYGENLHVGYVEHYHSVATEAPGVKLFDPRIKALKKHKHLYPGKDNKYAFTELLRKVREIVKSYGKEKIIVLNGGFDFIENADATMIESYICSWAWKGRNMNWGKIKEEAKKYKSLLKSGKQVIALSYLGYPASTVKDDAFFCYSAARLCGYIWTDYQTIGDNEANKLYQVNLGKVKTGLLSISGIDYKIYESGIIAINGNKEKRKVKLNLEKLLSYTHFKDLYSDKEIKVKDKSLVVEIPGESGRVYKGII